MEEKQLVMRQLVELDDSFVPPGDYKVCVFVAAERWALVACWWVQQMVG